MQGYRGLGLELLQGHAVGCSEKASTVRKVATPARTTIKGPKVSFFINPYKSKGDTTEILEKFNPASTSSLISNMS
jgi:hypothetical protein